MKNVLFIPFVFVPAVLTAQSKPAKILYYLDSALVAHNPLQYHRYAQGLLDTADLAYVDKVKANGHIFRNIVEVGYDSVMYVFTKAYAERSEDDKKIPSIMQLDARWKHRISEMIYYRDNRLYTGKVRNYHFNGKKEMEGNLENGRWTGVSKYYNKDGQLVRTIAYTKIDGADEEVHADATEHVYEKRRSKGNDGAVYAYYANGALKRSHVSTRRESVSLRYCSNGKLRDSAFTTRWTRLPKKTGRFWQLQDLLMKGKFEEAFRLDPGNPEIHHWRAISRAKDLQFDAAVADMDTAITLEPLEPSYAGYRALLRLRKHAYQRDQAKLEYDYKLVWYLKEHPPLPVSAAEKELILKDLKTAMVPGIDFYSKRQYDAAFSQLKNNP